MPFDQTTFGEIVKQGDLPAEEKAQIRDSIIYDAEHESEFYNEVNHEDVDENKTSMELVRSYLPKIDKTSDRYKNGLVEGVTPDPEQINEAEFSVSLSEMGWYFRFTNKALNHTFYGIKERCTKFLQNLFKSYHDEKIADAYLSSANTLTDAIDLLDYQDLLTLKTILFKNGAKPFAGGYYKLKVPAEIADQMLYKYKDLFTHTTQSENVVIGEIGEIAGFRVIASKLQAFQVSNSKGNFIAYGLTSHGKYPVSIAAYEEGENGEIIYKPLGSNGNDPLNQRGSIGFYIDGHGFYVHDDSACVRGECAAITGLTAISTFDNSKRSNLVAEYTASSNLYPDVTVFELAKAGTRTLVVKDVAETAVTSSCTFTSSDTSVATCDGTTKGKITGVKQGTAKIMITKGDYVTVVTVRVTA